jgi:hypothetical protein
MGEQNDCNDYELVQQRADMRINLTKHESCGINISTAGPRAKLRLFEE